VTRPPFIDRNDLGWVITFCAMFVAAIGVAPGEANHLVYLLPGLHAANPDFLASDWFVTQAHHPHLVFNALVAALARIGVLDLGLVLGTIAQSLAVALATWAVARQLYPSPLIPWAMTLMILGATGTHSVGLSLLISPQFEASTIAGAATVIGLACLASQRHTSWAGLAFGAAALFHAHFAVLILPVAAVAAAFAARRDGWARGLMILVPVLVLGLPSYLQVLVHQADPAVQMADSLVLSRFPHHYDPRTWGPVQGCLFAGILIAGSVGVVLRRPASRPILFSAVGLMAIMALVSLLIGYAGLSETVMLLAPWRLGSIVIVFAVLAACAAVPGVRTLDRRPRALLLSIAALCAVPVAMATIVGPIPVRVGLATGIALLVVLRSGWTKSTPGLHRTDLVTIALVAVGFLPGVWHGFERSHLSIGPATLQHPGLYRWAAESTDSRAVFAVPPGWIDFRLVTGRSIVADHKSPPTRPSELVEWARRIEALTGRMPRGEAAELDSAFFAGDCVRMRGLRDAYDVRFMIRRAGAPSCGETTYSDGSFSVVDLLRAP